MLLSGAALLLGLPLGVAAAGHAHGSLDRSFGKGGKATTAIGPDAIAGALAIQKDGKLVAAGFGNDGFALFRYRANGSLDRSFGRGGKVGTAIGSAADASALVIQKDGKLVAAGPSAVFASPHADLGVVVRYDPSGSLDRSFGKGGKVTPSGYRSIDALVIQPDGRLVAAGSVSTPSTFDSFALARYNRNGSLDRSFGKAGKVTTPIGPYCCGDAAALAIQPDGKLVAAGVGYNADGSESAGVVVRYNVNGSLDRSFGKAGKVTTVIGGVDDYPDALALQKDGKLVAGGYRERGSLGNPTLSDFALVRYNPNGSLDRSFGMGGKVTTPIGSVVGARVYALVIQPDGKIVAAGYSDNDFTLARYLG